MKAVFTDVFSLDVDDPLRFDLDSLDVRPITEFKDYHGVNVSIMAYLDRTRIPISIDIGFGDVIVPERVMMDFRLYSATKTRTFMNIPFAHLWRSSLRPLYLWPTTIRV